MNSTVEFLWLVHVNSKIVRSAHTPCVLCMNIWGKKSAYFPTQH